LYSSISAAYFEASLRSNSGGVRARLWQNNEGVAVSGSEVVSSVPASTHKSSGGIGLSGGNKLYIVQVRSETGQEPPLRPRLRRGFEGQARNKKLEEINLR